MYSSLHFCVAMYDVHPIVEDNSAARNNAERKATVTLVIGVNRICLLNAETWQLESIASDLLAIAQDVRMGNSPEEASDDILDAVPADQ